ncbi:MAG: hypothetical protein U0R17_04120 [Acidimicrobiia bacterium]
MKLVEPDDMELCSFTGSAMKNKALHIFLVFAVMIGLQIATLASASAANNEDISLQNVSSSFNGTAYSYRACNDSTTRTITSITFEFTATNFVVDDIYTPPFDGAPQNGFGSIDVNTNTWTGTLVPDTDGPGGNNPDCISLSAFGHTTGSIGETVNAYISVVSTTDSDNNAETGGPSQNYTPVTIAAPPDVEATARLATTGSISATDQVDYNVDVRNLGPGAYVNEDFFIFAFTLPEGASFVSAEDLDTSDGIDVSACNGGLYLGNQINFPGLEDYAGREVVVCQLSTPDGPLPADASKIYPFKIRIIAGAGIASGSTQVVGILEGNDPDTAEMFGVLSRGENIKNYFESEGNNNIFFLDYDPSALQVTVNPCPGQGSTTSDGNACFRVVFNKLIYAPSFTTGDIDLVGSGSISGFTQVDDYTWEVRVSGIARNSSATLNLKLNQIQDYSAVQNATQVLGINTIRFADSATAAGSLPVTGFDPTLLITSLLLLTIGYGVKKSTRKTVTA